MKFLAVTDDGETVFIEDSVSAVAISLNRGLPIVYYPINVDPDTFVPTLGEPAEIGSAGRVPIPRERVTVRSSGVDIGTAAVDPVTP